MFAQHIRDSESDSQSGLVDFLVGDLGVREQLEELLLL